MAIVKSFVWRKNEANADLGTTLKYDILPEALRIQVVNILQGAIGKDKHLISSAVSKPTFDWILNITYTEIGKKDLFNTKGSAAEKIKDFIYESPDVDEVLSCIEFAFRCIDQIVRKFWEQFKEETTAHITPDEAIQQLNERFKQHNIGYSFDGGQIIRVDSTLIHEEITKPAILFLSNKKFAGANEEYLKAHEHYRNQRNKECLAHCLMAFESTLKSICKEKNWIFKKGATAGSLIALCLKNKLIPDYYEHQLTALNNLFISGIPTLRNSNAVSHGQGQDVLKVGDAITRFGLNLTGTNILFLIELSGIK